MLQGVHTFLFSLSLFWPGADRFTSGGTPASERKNGPHCSNGALVERTQGLFFEENNKGVIMDRNINSINNLCLLFQGHLEDVFSREVYLFLGERAQRRSSLLSVRRGFPSAAF